MDRSEQFVQLELGDPEAWDDSALIDAYHAAVDAHTNSTKRKKNTGRQTIPQSHRKPPIDVNTPKDKHIVGATSPLRSNLFTPSRKVPDTPPSPSSSPPAQVIGSINKTGSTGQKILIPPPPPSLFGANVSEDLEKLLMTWYEAGYRAGLYAATSKSNK